MINKRFSEALEGIRMSPIVTISEIARGEEPEFKRKTGKDFVLFQRGEIDFPTPRYIAEAAKRALDDGKTKYPKSGGEDVFKDAILKKLADFNKAEGLTRENVVCTYGGQEALQLAFKLFEGERGAGFSPCWSCALENFVPYGKIDFRQVPLKEDFSIDFDELNTALRNLRFFYFNNPHNPTGKVFSEDEAREIAKLCKKENVFLISDEAYERIVFDGKEHFSATSLNLDNVIAAFTLSKTYSMTGWRLGYLVTKDKKIAELIKLGNYTQTAGVATFLQYAAKEALDNREEESRAVKDMLDEFQKRRDSLYNGLRAIDGLNITKPEGAFYIFPNFSNFIPRNINGREREIYVFNLLKRNGVATVYGSCFGKGFEDYVRLSFSTTPVPVIEEGVSRIKKALKREN